jgi:hypothetical protein
MTRTRIIILLFLMLAGVCVVVAPLAAKSGQNSAVFGRYEVTFKGQYQGTGAAHVITKKVVFIRGDLLDGKKGGAGRFLVVNLPLSDDGRFSGDGTFTDNAGKKVDVTVVGRVEPPDGVIIKKARIICTFTTAAGEAGRIYGAH